ncbi:hypothetical protein L13192_07692 [Pyrenophora tritici-repentis]|uniref:Uncharacterized protein n=2 Tax=Pyrenophora tritici-repentis TaxID=45151 RepID=A0A922N9Z4_9PLEO|nr:uncharacterized protein PTRG_05019 [Pyrenophora tritici-repentis Pt-1C-BFP]EDU47926.1 predicted protein [Pyrenophora tritici-repentis Pt-1C-BFP]KAI1510279.1 hypothetical protein Ptr86124_010725 [Pyrenophora tritici-repentis]KAI1668556.1 hypothetical protein L13192_07692 [Pyrenophora tritici-repentis]KAI1680633.1 hypothetical protein KJE20_09484 [Pyrenophora tritici-repentis]
MEINILPILVMMTTTILPSLVAPLQVTTADAQLLVRKLLREIEGLKGLSDDEISILKSSFNFAFELNVDMADYASIAVGAKLGVATGVEQATSEELGVSADFAVSVDSAGSVGVGVSRRVRRSKADGTAGGTKRQGLNADI